MVFSTKGVGPLVTLNCVFDEGVALATLKWNFRCSKAWAPLLHQKPLGVSHGLRVLLSVSVAMWQGGVALSVTSKRAENVFRHVREGPLPCRIETHSLWVVNDISTLYNCYLNENPSLLIIETQQKTTRRDGPFVETKRKMAKRLLSLLAVPPSLSAGPRLEKERKN